MMYPQSFVRCQKFSLHVMRVSVCACEEKKKKSVLIYKRTVSIKTKGKLNRDVSYSDGLYQGKCNDFLLKEVFIDKGENVIGFSKF